MLIIIIYFYLISDRKEIVADELDNEYEEESEIMLKCNFCDLPLAEDMDVLLTHCHFCKPRSRPSISFKYTCFICEYNTYYRESMRKHIRTHLGVKPFQCTICSYSAAQKNTLKRHLILHSGDLPFSCPLCDFVASRSYILTNHINKKHTEFKTDLNSEQIES
ncbi:zinc finger protein 64 homolog, isoforms 3 and 4-like [Diaphorina citri]|uniref:Zinc finger protein 64 homolog, isoforms 3 and 4-like n=1 Tax=Diaphorina citri TaxID=121845 RepID=A0A3Q0JBG9_DIACI|nr:zinc finger protein 64 homolog, isoforms 3 and 4-like [Diaphorina citri]